MTYEFPPYDGPPVHRLAKFRGQRQKWFALRFTGRDDEIDPLTPRNGQPAEFDHWRWERLDRVADLVVPFRRDVYRTVARLFAEFAGSTGHAVDEIRTRFEFFSFCSRFFCNQHPLRSYTLTVSLCPWMAPGITLPARCFV